MRNSSSVHQIATTSVFNTFYRIIHNLLRLPSNILISQYLGISLTHLVIRSSCNIFISRRLIYSYLCVSSPHTTEAELSRAEEEHRKADLVLVLVWCVTLSACAAAAPASAADDDDDDLMTTVPIPTPRMCQYLSRVQACAFGRLETCRWKRSAGMENQGVSLSYMK